MQNRAELRTSSGSHETVVFGMRADPHPGDRIRCQRAKSTIVVSDADGKTIRAAMQPAEME